MAQTLPFDWSGLAPRVPTVSALPPQALPFDFSGLASLQEQMHPAPESSARSFPEQPRAAFDFSDLTPADPSADTGVLTAIEAGRSITPRDVGASVGRGLQAVTEAPGLRTLFRGLRAPQQALVTGPLLGATEALRAGRAVSPRDVVRGAATALREDIAGRDVLKAAGVTGSPQTVGGLVLDLVADPLWLATPAKVAKLAGLPALLASRPVRAAATLAKESPPGRVLGRAFVTDFGKPTEYVQLAEQHVKDLSTATETAVALGRRIAQLPDESQRAVRRYMEAGTDAGRQTVLAEATTAGLPADDIGRLASEAMMRDIALGQQLTDVGLLSEQTFAKWRGRHLRREYLKHESPVRYLTNLATKDPEAGAKAEALLKDQMGWVGRTAPLRERLAFLKERQDIPEALRREMGEILEAAHPVAKGQALVGRAIATRRFFQQTADRFASPTLKPGYVYVGDTKALGPLAGTYLPEAVAADINRVVAKPSEGVRLWKQGVGWWKYGKVVLNPATHARNIMSNLMLADLAGLAPFKVHRYAQGAKALLTHDTWFQEAKGAGTFLDETFAARELPRFLDRAATGDQLQRGLRRVQQLAQKPADAYQFEEQLFKMAFYIDRRKAGQVPQAAAQAAETALFNYRRVPQFIDTLRTTGIVPFATFPYKALPATAKALAHRPAAVSRYGHLFRVFEADEAETERAVLPDYMQDGFMRLPGTDPQGRVRYVNLQYIFPFGDIGEIATLGGFGGRGGAKAGLISSPYLDVGAAVVSGRDPFTNQEIAKQPGGWRAWWQTFLLPPLAGGYAARELLAAAQGKPVNVLNRRAEPRSMGQAVLASVAGLRITPLDLRVEQQKRLEALVYEARDIHADLRRYGRSPWVTTEEREDAIAAQMDRLKALAEEAVRLRAVILPDQPVPSQALDFTGLAAAEATQ